MNSIIIPTYNEAENIETLVKEIHKILKKNYEIVIIDDNSPDLTWKIAGRLSKYNVKVIRRKRRLGLSSAVVEGFKKAKGKILCVMDADLSHPPSLIPKLIKELDKVDIAIGSRKIKGGEVEDWPLFNKLISMIATALARPLTKVKDPMSGYFAIKKDLIKDVNFTSRGYKILLEILVKANIKNFKEIPYTFENREKGKSKQSIKEYIYYLKDLTKLYLYKILNYST